MERAFYTLHLRAYLASKLEHPSLEYSDEDLVSEFATSIQALLRSAHGKNVCKHHQDVLATLRDKDAVITFNYDLVGERALRKSCEQRHQAFGPWLYGLSAEEQDLVGPQLLKLHGSSNWRINGKNFSVLTKSWNDFDQAPGYRGDSGSGTVYPIFLPFWDKRIEKNPWLSLWRTAYKVLARASELVVWGYSLQPTDIKAQQLFSLALAGKNNFNLCVIDPSQTTRGRWRDLFKNALYWEYESVKDFLVHPPNWWTKDA
jgi:hypothetical protein